MKWTGETRRQHLDRLSKPRQAYAWLPTQMNCGTWVWLETYWITSWRGRNAIGYDCWQHDRGLTPESVGPIVIHYGGIEEAAIASLQPGNCIDIQEQRAIVIKQSSLPAYKGN